MMAQIVWLVLNALLIVRQVEKDHTQITDLIIGLFVMNLILFWGGFYHPGY